MAEQKLYRISFEDPNCVEEVWATRLRGDHYRLDEAPLFTELATFHDVIEAEKRPDGTLRFKSVVEPSDYETSRFLLPEVAMDSDALAALTQRVEDLGGEWSLFAKGYLILHLPPDVQFDASREVHKMTINAFSDAQSEST